MYELTISLRQGEKTPLYEQIYDYIKNEIREGRISSGEKLPSTRLLSRHLDISRSTVELAYEQLLSEGYIESKPQRGYYVSQIDGLYQIRATKPSGKGSVKDERQAYRYDFTPNGVDLNSFPYNTWRKLSRECLLDDRAELFRLGCPQGEPGLRSAICSYLHQARGVNCSPDQIIVGAGNDYLMMLLCAVLGTGHRVALENPTYRQAYRLFTNLSFDTRTVDMDARGMRVDELERSGADLAFVMPSHQYPLGTVMPIRRRMELLRWASEAEGRYIIEDDYDSEFRYKGKPIPALQGYDADGKVIYIGTFSKSIAPAIRMSYMVLPEKVCEMYHKRCGFISSTVSKVDQLILQKFIEEGYYERHLNKMRALYRSRHDVLLSGLKEMGDEYTVSGENAGVHLLVHFRDGRPERELIRLAAEKGVKVYGLSEYYVDGARATEESVILLGYANMDEQKIKEAVRLLESAWKKK
ncbi:MAG TPA: PLP-dependent aminotransferase family protein [Candidatus Mediterraneibacter guildfordensis]|nr:PLP-dependent aminotransferase family protein [Candidatus Mediterraneibacter guildfordensis]